MTLKPLGTVIQDKALQQAYKALFLDAVVSDCSRFCLLCTRETTMIQDDQKDPIQAPAVNDGQDEPCAQITPSDTQHADSPSLQRQPKLADYLRIFGYAAKWDLYVYAIAALASIGAGVSLPLMNIIFGQLVGQFTDYFRDNAAMPQDKFERLLAQQALYIMALFLARWALNSINKFCFRMIGIRLSSAVRLHYLQSLLAQSIEAIDSMPPGAPATAITATTNTLQLGVSEHLGTFLQFNGTIWAALIIAFIWSWNLTLVTSSLVLYVFIVLGVFLPLILKGHTAVTEADGQATAIASEALGGIRLVMACCAQDRILTRYDRWVAEARKRAQKIEPVIAAQLGMMFFGVFGTFGLAFWYGMQRYKAGAIDNAGVIVIVLMSVMMILTSMERISTPLMAVSKAMVAACELFTVIDAAPPAHGTLRPDMAGQDIVFDNVTFAYPSRPGVTVLNNMSFHIQSGQQIAFVGASGSGKSTIVGLLERWYTLGAYRALPQVTGSKTSTESTPPEKVQIADAPRASEGSARNGSIRVGNHDIKDLDLKWWRSQIGLVQQEPFLFNDTIFNNVAHGLIGTEWADATEERKRQLVQEACAEAYADNFIQRLPDKYYTRVGDSGAKLSGGQRQRIAIARSIIKKPRIIIFDEATSAIDVKSERIVQAAIDRISKNRTTITIAHRLSTVKKSDCIFVLSRGQVVESGTHECLMEKADGVYRNLALAQSLHLSAESEPTAGDEPSEVLVAADKALSDVDGFKPLNLAQKQDVIKNADRGVFRSFGKLLYEQKTQWPSYLGMILGAMCVAAGTPLQAWLFAKAVGLFLLQQNAINDEANFWGLMWFALAGGVGLSYFTQGWFSLHIQNAISAFYKKDYLKDMLYQRLGFFDEDANAHGSLSSRVSSDAKQLEELLGLNLAFLLSGVFTVVGCAIIALVFAWKLGLVAMFVTLPIMVGSGFWKYRYEVQFNDMNARVFAESSQFATEAIGAMRTVSALTMEDCINDRYKKLLDEHVNAAFQKAKWTSAFYGFADSTSIGCQALVFWYGGKLLAAGEFSMEAFFVCFMAIIQGAESASQALAVAPNAAQATAAANRILDLRETASMDRGNSQVRIQSKGEDNGGVRIELRNVSFKYPTRDLSIFDSLSLTIEKGQYAAFVGPSGCGKTTIISLLLRFYEVNNGHVMWNDADIKDFDLYQYRHSLSLVAQEPIMFDGTIRSNVLFGIDDPSTVSDEQLHQVCRDAFIHDFVISLPEGYDTNVGQKGVSLSGGQKQRISIARALIRNPQLLLLDEATSALDSESEKTVQAALEKASQGRTTVAVAHRIATVQNADVIFVFDEGKVVEKGTHMELVRRQGVYFGMANSDYGMTRTKVARTSTSKVRTGCLTCKKRHVKCDEGKPKCGNCVRSDRHCEGYDNERNKKRQCSDVIEIRWDSRQAARVSPLRTQVQLSTDLADFQNASSVFYFEEFVRVMQGPRVASGYHSSLWAVALPQLARQNSPLRHAAIGIGALSVWYCNSQHETPHGVSMSANVTVTPDMHYSLAVAHYCESLRLHSQNSTMQDALFLSVLSLYFEIMRGNMQAALDHLNHGLAILVALLTDEGKEWKINALAPNPKPVIAFVGDLFSQLIPQSRSIMRGGIRREANLPNFAKSLKNKKHTVESFMVLLSQNSRSSAISYHIPQAFQSLDEFEDCWIALRRQQTELGPLMIEVIRNSEILRSENQDEIARLWSRLTGDPRIREFCENSTSEIQAMHAAYSPLFDQIMASDSESPEYLRAIHLRLQGLGVSTFADPTKYHDITDISAQTPLFREYLLLADMALRIAKRTSQTPAQNVSLQSDLTLHILLVALFCRDPLVREQAIWLLKDYPGRDGLWDPQALYIVAVRNKTVEKLNTSEGTPAEQWFRLWRREYLFENCGQRVVFSYLDNRNESGKWLVVEEVADVHKDLAKVVWRRRPPTAGGKLLMGDVLEN
ncbi:Multidrug resistance protein 1-like protein 1 [Paramyrothecium foliicola]|nr:Multidrug resistance protein 1-like protein 1 [Paramyrothecium foliicola]